MKPRALAPGSTIALVSPASPILPEKLATVTALLEAEGYAVRPMPHAFDNDVYLAGNDQDRGADLMAAFDDPSVDAVYCTRGGYGCARLFPYLDLDRIAASGKMLLGFSDVTTLHAALNRRGVATVHAPMGITLSVPRAPWVHESFLRTLRGESSIPSDAPGGSTVVDGIAEGTVVGGCLCLICDSIATPDEVPFEGSLLLIEDVEEAPHRVDAMLTHLINSGRAQQVAGFVVGEMTRTDEKVDESIGGKGWRSIVIERLAPLGKPMMIDFPFGHAPQMLTLPLGIRARLDASAGRLEYLESLCV